MKGFGKSLIIGGILLLAGTVFLIIGIAMANAFGPKTKNAENLTEQQYTLKGASSLNEINFMMVNEDVTVSTEETEEMTITYYDDPKHSRYEISEKGGRFQMKRKDESQLKFTGGSVTDIAKYIGQEKDNEGEKTKVTVVVPQSYRGSYDIAAVSGNIDLSGIESDKKLSCANVSGSTKLQNVSVNGNINMSSVSGSMDMENIRSGGKIELNTTSGETFLLDIFAADDLECTVVSGDISGNGVQARKVDVSGVSGSIDIKGINVDKAFEGNSVSGGFRLDFAGKWEDYRTEISTISGSSDMPKESRYNGDKKIEVETTSGDIHVGFADT